MQEGIKIRWLGHSCFKVEFMGYSVVFDPYEDGYVPGLKPLREEADKVLCSHDHGDHNAKKVITERKGGKCPVCVQTISTWHDDRQGALRGKNLIHLLEWDSFRIAHLGDLGCQLLPEQEDDLKGLDLLMVPVGGYYTINARQAKDLVERICPRVTVPMHYRGENFGFDVLAPLEDYRNLCDDVVFYENSEFFLTKDLPKQTAVLKIQ